MCNFDHFDFLAPLYDRVIRTQHPENLILHLKLPSSGILLDAGGGTGRIANVLKPYVEKVIVADLSFGMLRQAVQKDGLWTTCAFTETLPFGNNDFDRIVMVDALHHVINARITCRELWRVLKPGGKIVIEEPNIKTLPVKIVAVVEKMALMRSHFYEPNEIAGFFDFKGSDVLVKLDGYTSWTVVSKEFGN